MRIKIQGWSNIEDYDTANCPTVLLARYEMEIDHIISDDCYFGECSCREIPKLKWVTLGFLLKDIWGISAKPISSIVHTSPVLFEIEKPTHFKFIETQEKKPNEWSVEDTQ